MTTTLRRLEYRGDDRPRLDQFLATDDELGITRSGLRRLIDDGDVTVNGEAAKPSVRLRDGDVIEVRLTPPVAAHALPQAMALVILHEDADIIVIDKPAGLVVHPAPGHPDHTLVNALLAHCGDLAGVGGELRPGIVHRLDKDTSGVLVATKNDAAHVALAAQFKAHTLDREYIAVVAPPPGYSAGTIDTWYGRHPTHRKKFSSRVTAGKRAVTHFRVEEWFAGVAARVRCRLQTGRTHQIRVHMADSGSPVIGDPLYARGGKKPGLTALADAIGRQALHAAVLAFSHPRTGEPLRFETPPPADMQALLAALREPGAG